jgi:hypothetical protein
VAHYHQQSLNIYIVQVLLLLVAPALFAASIYMVLGRLITFTGAEAMSPIRVRWLTKIFVCGDVFSFLVQSGGNYRLFPCFLALHSVCERPFLLGSFSDRLLSLYFSLTPADGYRE